LPDSIDDVQLHLAETFPDIANSPYFEDYARIGSYLSDPNQYRRALEQLHSDMEQRFNANLERIGLKDVYPKWKRGFRQYLTTTYMTLSKSRPSLSPRRETAKRDTYDGYSIAIAAFRKILTDSLKANELQNGFHVGSNDDKIDILIGFPEVIDGKSEFNNFLRQKKLFKDLSAGKEHGENSHRIQWYLISKMGTLSHAVANIYASLPPFRTIKRPTDPRSFYLWEFLVDRDGVPSNAAVIPFKTKVQTDFRAPSNVNRCLYDGVAFPHLDLLIAVVNERWDRRDGFLAGNYLGKKVLPPGYKPTREDLDILWAEVASTVKVQDQVVIPAGKNRILYR